MCVRRFAFLPLSIFIFFTSIIGGVEAGAFKDKTGSFADKALQEPLAFRTSLQRRLRHLLKHLKPVRAFSALIFVCRHLYISLSVT